MGEDLSGLGEREVIRRVLARVPQTGPGVVVGPGDDAAILDPGGPVVVAADVLVEGVHFDLAFSAPSDVGYKALTVNVSDIAAMGATARWALLSLGAPEHTAVAELEALADGLGEAAREHGVALVGGDTVGAPHLFLSIAVAGVAEHGRLLRSGALEGDLLCVTGSVGAAVAGLELLRRAATDPEAAGFLEAMPPLPRAHRRGRARTREGPAAALAGASAAIDVSDGLAVDAWRLAEASGLGVELEASSIPLADGVAQVAGWLGEPAWALGARGGDDYELLIALAPGAFGAVRDGVAPTPLTAVGTFGGPERVLVTPGGDRLPLEDLGWDHYGAS